MRNWTRCSGVYSNMLRVPLSLVCSLAALAQQLPQQDPLDAAIQAVWQARGNGRFADAAAGRERARAMLQHAPLDSPRFAGWVQQVAQLYQNASLNAQARAILQEALGRTGSLPDSHPSHIAMLSALGESWRQDGNLLKAVGYLELSATAQAAAPPAQPRVAAGQPVQQVMIVSGSRLSLAAYGGRSNIGSAIDAYTRLADLYRQLGRPDAVGAVAVKIRALGSNDEAALARFYEQQGQLEEAAAIYQKLAEQSPNAQAKANAWQSLANLYERQERHTDAIAAIQQAIAAVQSSDKPGNRSQATWMRQTLAGFMRQAGQLDQADQVYQQMLQENRGGPQEGQILGMYAQHLADTERGAQGESVLKDYLAGSSNLDPQQRMNVLFNLSDFALRAGDSKRAEEYQKAGQALMPQQPPLPAGQIRIGEELRKAQDAVNQHRLEDAYGLALHVIDSAAHATDGQQVEWLVNNVAHALAANKEPAKAEQLFQRLFALGQDWSVDSLQPLIAVSQNYARFLMSQPDRSGEVTAAIEHYRRILTDANGPESGSLADPLRMKIEFERSHSQWEQADASARELLELQESLSGDTSDPYLSDLQNAARTYQAAGHSVRSIALFRKAITIAELLDTPEDNWRRSQTRMEAAQAMARLGQYDEAERLGEEAVGLQRSTRTPRPPLAQELEQIRRMKQAAAKAGASRVDK